MLPDRETNRREYIHSICTSECDNDTKTTNPQSIKQVLCQSGALSEIKRFIRLKTIACTRCAVGAQT
jgi:hypothetical protein